MFVEIISSINSSASIYNALKDYRVMRNAFGMKNSSKTSKKIEHAKSFQKKDEECEHKDRICVKGLAAIAMMNGPNDLEDIVSAWKQIKTKFKEKCPDGYNPKEAQHPFSFFRGTIFHKYLNPNSEKCINERLAKKIIKNDISLMDTNFGNWIRKKLQIVEKDSIETIIEDITHTESAPMKVVAKVYEAPTKFGEITARALSRTPKLAVYTLGSLAAVHAAYEIIEGEDITKELSKAAFETIATLAGVAYLGAIGYKHFATCGSLIGMGLGALMGEKVTDLLLEHKPKS